MEALLYFIIWAAAIFVMMRFGCGAHVMGHGRKHGQTEESPKTETSELRWVPPEIDTDPVCGKVVSTNEARATVHAGTVLGDPSVPSPGSATSWASPSSG